MLVLSRATQVLERGLSVLAVCQDRFVSTTYGEVIEPIKGMKLLNGQWEAGSYLEDLRKRIDPPVRTVSITWPTDPKVISEKVKETVERLLVKPGDFSDVKLTEPQKRELQSVGIDGAVAKSIRKQILLTKTAKNTAAVRRSPFVQQQMVQEFKKGESIESIAKKADLPPTTVARVVVPVVHNVQPAEVKKAIKHPEVCSLPAEVIQELQIIEKKDTIAKFDLGVQRECAREFEITMENYFSDFLNVRFQTEEDLIACQRLAFGKPFATPDLLFIDRLIINDCPVNWLDTKRMFGHDSLITTSQMLKQSKRYTAMWGPGAILFSRGFSSSLQAKLPSLLLDIHHVPFFKPGAFKCRSMNTLGLFTTSGLVTSNPFLHSRSFSYKPPSPDATTSSTATNKQTPTLPLTADNEDHRSQTPPKKRSRTYQHRLL